MALFIIAAYLSLAIELIAIPVPSVASAVQLARNSRRERGGSGSVATRLRYYLPVLVNIAVFLWPLAAAINALLADDPAGLSMASSAVAVSAALFIVAGRSLTIASALALRAQSRLRLAEGELHAPLRQSGVFALSRNPGLLGMYLFALGLLLLLPSPLFALGLLHYLWHMHRRVKIEEAHLSARLGDDYREYAARTRRYV